MSELLAVTRDAPADLIVGRNGPVLMLNLEHARELLPAVRAHAVELRDRGATARLGRIWPVLQAWESLVERFEVEPPPSAGTDDGGRFPHEPIDVQTAAATLGCTPQHVTRLLRRGDLDGHKPGGVWIVDVASVDRHRAHTEGHG